MQDDPLWYKDAIIYQLHVKTFYDSDNDGFGDFRGLTQKLDYVSDLGVNTLWLLPFYPSPLRDDGYDVSDYRDVHPDYGKLADFKRFVRAAHARGLRVITELVINHTSDQHAWFQAARKAKPGSAKREFYVWSDNDEKFPETRIIFTDTESSNWTWDPEARAYYWHRFFSHQPDLNHNNPRVVDAVIREMRFWLDAGVDGLRLDAIPYLCVREGTSNENLPETHAVIRRMRAAVDKRYADRMFLAEANQWPEDVREYFGDGDECHMAYHFPLMPRMYMAVAQEDRYPITEILQQTPEIPNSCQWAIFLRNHDELTLEMVTDRERDYMYAQYAQDPRMRVNVGIRRRLAPLMDNDIDKIKLMNSLLLSMPGSPIIYYGDEIGMGDNIYLGDRNGVRTPMQWTPDRNAGFSRCDPQRLYLPPIMDAVYGYEAVNVEAQSRDPASLLNWMKRLIAVRKAYRAFGRGALQLLKPGNRKILAYLREYEDETILCVANLSHSAQPVELDLSRFQGAVPVEMLGHTPFPPIGELPYLLTLAGHGVYWFRLSREAEVPAWHEERLAPLELPVLVTPRGWDSFLGGGQRLGNEATQQLRRSLEREVLPAYLPGTRWFGDKGGELRGMRFQSWGVWKGARREWLLASVDVELGGGDIHTYFLPLARDWDEEEEAARAHLPATLAKVRQQARMGIIYDAFSDGAFVLEMLGAIGEGRSVDVDGGRVHFRATAAMAQQPPLEDGMRVDRPPVEGSNSATVVGERFFVKGYRRMNRGPGPELEIGRFLTERVPFEHIIPVLGTLEYEDGRGEDFVLAVAQPFVENQGDAWGYTLDYLERFLDACQFGGDEGGAPDLTYHDNYLALIATLGRRTGQLHRALATPTGDPAFEPEAIATGELQGWGRTLAEEATAALDALERDGERGGERPAVAALLQCHSELIDLCERVLPDTVAAVKTRHHGDYHLGQVLVTENDFMIIDFEGEPARPLAERRRKHSPLRDVAGMLRSFEYAAHVALEDAVADRPADTEGLRPHVRAWTVATQTAFLAAYRDTVSGSPVVPETPAETEAMITFFALEKAVYELRYEMNNRPNWVEVPARGLLELLETAG